jgi:hypothetical protein
MPVSPSVFDRILDVMLHAVSDALCPHIAAKRRPLFRLDVTLKKSKYIPRLAVTLSILQLNAVSNLGPKLEIPHY